MRATDDILQVWRLFDGFPMETLTKAWWLSRTGGTSQRPIALMEEHREAHGTSGNCFDLAIWLLSAMRRARIEAYAVGSSLFSTRAHVAVVAVNYLGNRYLCDLGDQWIEPVLIDSSSPLFSPTPVPGFFPGAEVSVATEGTRCEITYHRHGGKASFQVYDLRPVSLDVLLRAGERSQALLRQALCEKRIGHNGETALWEFCNWESWLSTNRGIIKDDPAEDSHGWVERVHQMSGISQDVVATALSVYARILQA